MSYEKPPINKVPFKFSSTGYSTPEFSNVPFRFNVRPSHQQTADMKATINVFGIYCTSTYTYVKDRQTYIVGYTTSGVQILKDKTIYGGIRDLCASLVRAPTHVDISAYIRATSNFLDLNGYIKSTIQAYADIIADIYGVPPSDLSAFIHGFDTRSMPATIYGLAIRDISAYIGTHPPSNLAAILNVIEIRDLTASVVGNWWHGSAELAAKIYRIFDHKYKNLQAILHGWQEVNISAYIKSVYFRDLVANIQSSAIFDLLASLTSIGPVDLPSFIHGFDLTNISAYLNGQYGPYDIQASLTSIPPQNLLAYIKGFKGLGVEFDLRGYISGWGVNNLGAFISPIRYVDLVARLNVFGKSSDITASIIPNTILMKKAIQISLLEHKDLNAVVNFMCFGSGYRDLPAYMYTIYKLDLGANIIGYGGGTPDFYSDLKAYINSEDYIVQDKFTLKYIPEIDKYARLRLRFGVTDKYITWDTFDILYSTYYAKDLTASITGVLNSSDLSASLTAMFDWNYSELPEYVKPKTHEVFININRFEDQWRRFVEIIFDKSGTKPFEYFYVSGTNRVYKIDRSRNWTIWVSGYNTTDDSLIERTNVRRKYIFNLSNYSTIDEAIRDLMEFAAYPLHSDLVANIYANLPNHIDITASIDVKSVYSWVKHLSALVVPYFKESTDINAKIEAELFKGSIDINALVSPIDPFTAPSGDEILFTFESNDYTPPDYDNVDTIWTGDD